MADGDQSGVDAGARERIGGDLRRLMLTPGLSGYEGRVSREIKNRLAEAGIDSYGDIMGNRIATLPGDPDAPSVMLLTHMDQLGFVVRKIEPDGFLRVERVGGVPEKALASQAVLVMVADGEDRIGVIANKSHHATTPDEKYRVTPYQELYIDIGLLDAAAVRAAGIEVGAPIVYRPQAIDLPPDRMAGTSVDDRAGCAVLLEVARRLKDSPGRPTVHIVFTVQEEFNLRGAVPAAQALKPAIAIQLDLLLTGDTPDMRTRTDVTLGGGPGISLYSFHGRGTLNGTIPHPALTRLFETAAARAGTPLQRSAQTGILTETSYIQLIDGGVASIDIGFPMRYSHSSLEVCDLRDLTRLADLITAAMPLIDPDFSLDREGFEP